jgi:hypothetical protein
MAENKTRAAGASVQEFLAGVEHPVRRQDGLRLLALMSGITGEDEAVLAALVRAGYRHTTTVLHAN